MSEKSKGIPPEVMDVAAAIWRANPGGKSIHIVFDPETGTTQMEAHVAKIPPDTIQPRTTGRIRRRSPRTK